MTEPGQDWPVEWEDPADVAAGIEDFASGDGEGVYHDTLVEAQMSLDQYSKRMEEVHIQLDAIIDDMEFIEEGPAEVIMEMDRTAMELSRYFAACQTEVLRLLRDDDVKLPSESEEG